MSRDLIEKGLGWSWTPQRVLRHIRNRETNVIVACSGRSAVGFGIMRYLEEEAHLVLLAVETAHQRRGIGASLVRWLEAPAEAAGVARIRLEARAENIAARAFYQSLGYSTSEIVAGYYSGRESAIRLVKERRQPSPPAA